MQRGQSKSKVYVLTGIGVLVVFLIGGLSDSLMNNGNSNDASNESETSKILKSNNSSKTKEASKQEKRSEPNLMGAYVADTGTDATVKSLGKNEWKINYKTGPESVYGTFKTNWKKDTEGFTAKGTMYKGEEKYEFDFMVKVISAKEGDDAVLIEFSDGDLNHLMTFKNKKARDAKLTGSNGDSQSAQSTQQSGGMIGINSYEDLLKEDAWRYRAALIARSYLADSVLLDKIVSVSYKTIGSGNVGNPDGEQYKSDNIQMIAVEFEAPVQGANVQAFGMDFAKDTNDKYIVHLTRTGGFVKKKTNQVFSLKEAYGKFNDSTTDTIAKMIKVI